MQQQTMIAVYQSRAEAEQARDRLMALGVPQGDIRLSDEATAGEIPARQAHREPGFLEWLFGAEPPEADRQWYETNLHGGRTAVSIRLRDGAVDAQRVHAALEEFGPIDIGTASAGAAGMAASSAGTEEVIPVEKEELHVGKRQTETRHRIRTYVVERPVEQRVDLKDETVIVERRPAQGAQSGTGDFQERDIEVVERHEEPVVAKRTRADEEVVVKKTTQERPETVRDKVRETRVEVDKSAAGDKPPTKRE